MSISISFIWVNVLMSFYSLYALKFSWHNFKATSSLWSFNNHLGSSSSLCMSKGFGESPSDYKGLNDEAGFVNIKIPQQCPCGSGLYYDKCCKILHDTPFISDYEPSTLVRARYTAYALGVPKFLVSTIHPNARDMRKYSSDMLDVAKSYKAWNKEIIKKNTDAFEFSKLEIVAEDSPEDREAVIKSDESFAGKEFRTVRFLFLGKERATKRPIPIEEISAFERYNPLNNVFRKEIGDDYLTTNKEVMEGKGGYWIYSHGLLSPMPLEKMKKMISELPKYATKNAKIKDRW